MIWRRTSEEGVYRSWKWSAPAASPWEDAAKHGGGHPAAKTLRDLRIAEVTKLDLKIEDGKSDRLPGPAVSLLVQVPGPDPRTRLARGWKGSGDLGAAGGRPRRTSLPRPFVSWNGRTVSVPFAR